MHFVNLLPYPPTFTQNVLTGKLHWSELKYEYDLWSCSAVQE